MESVQVVDPVFVRIDNLLKKQGRQQKELIDFLSMARNTYGNWKTQRTKSYLKHIDEIADFFGVSPNYLIRGDEINGFEYLDELKHIFSKLNDKKAKAIIDLIKILADTQE